MSEAATAHATHRVDSAQRGCAQSDRVPASRGPLD